LEQAAWISPMMGISNAEQQRVNPDL